MPTLQQTYVGPELAGQSSTVMSLMLVELRLISYLLHQMNAGNTSDDQLDELRDMVSQEPHTVTTIVS